MSKGASGSTGGALRIALVHPYAWPDVRRGGERYLDDLAWYLSEVGHDVDVITGTEGASSVSEGRVSSRRRHHVLPGALRRRGVSPVDTFGLIALPSLVRRRYDVVHALTPRRRWRRAWPGIAPSTPRSGIRRPTSSAAARSTAVWWQPGCGAPPRSSP